ncbi:MAG: helix-turn-helix domain-containing protein [Clostridia bacterium]|nr:helix-turn-helix domain-containing protein [Clostridia bacterium]
MTFGQTLKALRREHDMTQEQLAELLRWSNVWKRLRKFRNRHKKPRGTPRGSSY